MASLETMSLLDMAQTQSNITIFSSVDDMISSLRSLIFSFDYPVYSESWKTQLETEILQYYFQYEISISPFALWQMKLKNKLMLIMPYYNKLYESTQRQFDYLKSVDLETTTTGNENATNHSLSDSSQNSKSNITKESTVNNNTTNEEHDLDKNTNSSTSNGTDNVSGTNQSVTNTSESSSDVTANVPQLYSESYDFDSQKGIKNGTGNATTNSTLGNNSTTSNSTSGESENTTSKNSTNSSVGNVKESDSNTNEVTNNNTNSNVLQSNKTGDSKTQGFQGSYSKAILEYRETLIKLDEMIIKDLADMFFFVCDC